MKSEQKETMAVYKGKLQQNKHESCQIDQNKVNNLNIENLRFRVWGPKKYFNFLKENLLVYWQILI